MLFWVIFTAQGMCYQGPGRHSPTIIYNIIKERLYMKVFMDKDFLLETPTAQHLYHDYSAKLPIVDYHCHIPPQEIYENRRFENIAQVWLGGHQVLADGSDYYFGDHYKWRVMRSNGVTSRIVSAFRSLPRAWKWPSATRCIPGATSS